MKKGKWNYVEEETQAQARDRCRISPHHPWQLERYQPRHSYPRVQETQETQTQEARYGESL